NRALSVTAGQLGKAPGGGPFVETAQHDRPIAQKIVRAKLRFARRCSTFDFHRLRQAYTIAAMTDAGTEDGGAEVSSGCSGAISGENAQALYAKIKDREGADHCKLEEVRTAGDVMRVEWKKDGALVPAAEIRPRECSQGGLVTGPEFSLSAPAATLS